MKPKDVAVAMYSFVEFGLCTAVFLPIMALSHRRHEGDPTQRMPGRWMRRFGRTTTNLSPVWRFRVEGDGPKDIDRRAYVVVANHESTADPFLLSHLPWDMRWVAKQEIFDLPILGKLMTYGGDIPLRRGQKDSVVEMFAECRRTLEAGMSVMMFPEGTRSKDGKLLPFKDGAFELAIDAGVPILPVALAGTRDCMPKGAKWLGNANATARVLSAIPTEGLTRDDVPRLRDQAREAIGAGVTALRADLGLHY
jgi:1-acyl-sn-glycerol-3-phosphate acyltransferase